MPRLIIALLFGAAISPASPIFQFDQDAFQHSYTASMNERTLVPYVIEFSGFPAGSFLYYDGDAVQVTPENQLQSCTLPICSNFIGIGSQQMDLYPGPNRDTTTGWLAFELRNADYSGRIDVTLSVYYRDIWQWDSPRYCAGTTSFTLDVKDPVPEPGTLALIGVGLLGLGGCCAGKVYRRRRTRPRIPV